jgi:hypothetical protein
LKQQLVDFSPQTLIKSSLVLMNMVILNGYNRNKVIGGSDLTFFMLRNDLFYFWLAEFEMGWC